MPRRATEASGIGRVLRALGSDAERVVIVGAAATSFYPLRASVAAIRQTFDLDLLLEVRTRASYYEVLERVRAKGRLKSHHEPDAPMCRVAIDDVPVDLMPIDSSVLGFTNRWYEEASRWSITTVVDGEAARMIDPMHFVATKLAAFEDPHRFGHGDFLASHDIEDALLVLIGVDQLVERIVESHLPAAVWIRERIDDYVAAPLFRDAFFGQFPYAAERAAADRHWRRVLSMRPHR